MPHPFDDIDAAAAHPRRKHLRKPEPEPVPQPRHDPLVRIAAAVVILFVAGVVLAGGFWYVFVQWQALEAARLHRLQAIDDYVQFKQCILELTEAHRAMWKAETDSNRLGRFRADRFVIPGDPPVTPEQRKQAEQAYAEQFRQAGECDKVTDRWRPQLRAILKRNPTWRAQPPEWVEIHFVLNGLLRNP